MPRRELARFLRERRESLSPADVGLPADHRRRTPGLRREEVALLAHVSADYCARIEQARGPRPSPRVLDGLADALRLTAAERTHLFRLAGTEPTPPPGPPRRVRPYVTALLDRLPEAGAIVTDASYDVVAANPPARALFGDLAAEPNLALRRFLGRGGHEVTGAEDFGRIAVSRLRAAADRYPRDARLATVLAQLRAGSREFAELWPTDPVYTPGHRVKTLLHPELGPLRINCDVLTVPDDDQQVVFVTADPDTPAARALRHLRETAARP